ncbi:MAG: hypothetical protein ACLTYN_01030 [Dysosmobacter welbionis]
MDHARKRGQTVYVETCPQYLLLDERVFQRGLLRRCPCVCAPPPAGQGRAGAPVEGPAAGRYPDRVHRPLLLALAQKDMGGRTSPNPSGLPGVETGRAAVLLRRGQAEDQRRPDGQVLSEIPPGCMVSYPRKGVRAGSDADRGLRPRRQPCDPSGGLRGQCGLQPL